MSHESTSPTERLKQTPSSIENACFSSVFITASVFEGHDYHVACQVHKKTED
jgi:hypothetical protein